MRKLLQWLGLVAHDEFEDITAVFHKAVARLTALENRKVAHETLARQTASNILEDARVEADAHIAAADESQAHRFRAVETREWLEKGLGLQ